MAPPKKRKAPSKSDKETSSKSNYQKVKTSYPAKTKRKRSSEDSVDDPIPGNQLEKFGEEPDLHAWNVRLSDPMWDLVSIRNVKFDKADAFTIRYNFPTAYRFFLHAYSPEGLKEGKNGSAIYIRLNGNIPAPSKPKVKAKSEVIPSTESSELKEDDKKDEKEKEAPLLTDRKFKMNSNHQLEVVLQNVDKYSEYAVTALNPLLEKEFEQRFGSHNTRLLSGLQQYEKDCDTVVRGEEYALYPHRKWSKFKTADKTDDPVIQESKANLFIDCTGNSYFILALKVKALEIRYTRGTKADNGTMTVQPYVNVETVTWLNEGQDVEAVVVDKETRQLEAQERRDKELTAALGL